MWRDLCIVCLKIYRTTGEIALKALASRPHVMTGDNSSKLSSAPHMHSMACITQAINNVI